MQNHDHGAKRRMRTIALALFCGAAFAGMPALANPSYSYKTIAATDINNTPGSFANLFTPSISDTGQVAFYAQTWCGGHLCSGVFSVDPTGVLTQIIDGGSHNSYPYMLFNDAVANDSGAVSFAIENVVSATTASNWLDLWKPGQIEQIVPTRAITSSTGAVYLNARLLNSGKVLYAATDTHLLMLAVMGKPPRPAAPGYCTASDRTGSSLNGWVATFGGPVGASCQSAGILATYIPTGVTRLRVPDDGTYGQLDSVTVNSVGTVLFSSRNLPGRTNVEGLFQQKVGAAVQKLAEIDNGACANAPPPSGSCQYRGYANPLMINAKGQTLANVQISTWTSGNPNPSSVSGVVRNGNIQNGQVAWPGMMIDGCNVFSATVGPRSINKYGQIVMWLNCRAKPGTSTGYLALVIATPPIR
jgi:hypothetical protein